MVEKHDGIWLECYLASHSYIYIEIFFFHWLMVNSPQKRSVSLT